MIGYRARHRIPGESVSHGGADGNIGTIERIYEALGRGDLATVLDAVDDDVDWAAEACSAGTPWHGTRHGRDDLERALAEYASAVEVLEFTPLRCAATGDDVLSVVRCRVRSRDTGRTVAMNLHQLFTFTGGRIAYYRGAHTALTEETVSG
jgi:hypothetical protein